MFKFKIIFNDISVFNIFFNNNNLYKTVIWLKNNLGEKKYYIPNEINVIKNTNFVNFLTHKYYYFKYCVLYSILIKNDIYGLMRGFKTYLIVRGLGFRIQLNNNFILFKLGYSHTINYKIPLGVKIIVLPKKLKALQIVSNNYQQVKEIASHIKNFRKPSNYKNQGIFFYKEKRKLKDSKKKSR